MVAAAAGFPFRISYGGSSQYQYVPDVARLFVAAARARPDGAEALNLGGTSAPMHEGVDAIEAACAESAGTIGHEEVALPFPAHLDDQVCAACSATSPTHRSSKGWRHRSTCSGGLSPNKKSHPGRSRHLSRAGVPMGDVPDW